MNPFLRLIPLFLFTLTLLSASPALAASKLQDVRGTVMAAETNKPIEGAEITFFTRNDKGIAAIPSIKTVSGTDGTFRVRLPTGSYAWFVKAEGLGTLQSAATVSNKALELSSVYLRKPAELFGRIVDKSGAPLAGVRIAADKLTSTTSAIDGRFRFVGLDPHGYEPALAKAGWVLEKSSYYYLSPGEQKDMGDLVICRAATLTVRLTVRENGRLHKLDSVRINLSGNTIYRSIKADKRGVGPAERPAAGTLHPFGTR